MPPDGAGQRCGVRCGGVTDGSGLSYRGGLWRQRQQQTPQGDPRRELDTPEKALALLKAEEAATVQAQIAGIKQGLSPDAYAGAFAALTIRRKGIEECRAALTTSLSRALKLEGVSRENVLVSRTLDDALIALTSQDITGLEKRLLLGTIVEKVVPHKDGADVFFAPGVFLEAEAENGPASEESGHTFHTTCIVCNVQGAARTIPAR